PAGNPGVAPLGGPRVARLSARGPAGRAARGPAGRAARGPAGGAPGRAGRRAADAGVADVGPAPDEEDGDAGYRLQVLSPAVVALEGDGGGRAQGEGRVREEGRLVFGLGGDEDHGHIGGVTADRAVGDGPGGDG